ncbi:MAG: maleylpyruvate isomerase family mycothiol-dependent enzyme [Nitriliruptoraceae bacterium]
MTVETTRQVDEIVPITRSSDARQVALAAYDRLLELLRSLEPGEWRAPTACPGWDVAAMVGHLIGAAKAGGSVRENLRQQAWGKRHARRFGGNTLDAANQRQILDHAGLSPAERVDELARIAPAAVAGRLRLPRPMRRVSVAIDAGGSTARGMPDRLALGHLMDVVYTRDVWLHTIDIARATGRTYRPDPAVDGRLVEDVVAEWAGRHGQPFLLTLTGPAGGRFRQGDGGGHLHLDAIDLCLLLSGRAQPGDADVEVVAEPASAAELLATRVLF